MYAYTYVDVHENHFFGRLRSVNRAAFAMIDVF